LESGPGLDDCVRAATPGHILQLSGFGASPIALMVVVPSVLQSGFSTDTDLQPGYISLLLSHCDQLGRRHYTFALVNLASLACSLSFAHASHEAETNVFDKKPQYRGYKTSSLPYHNSHLPLCAYHCARSLALSVSSTLSALAEEDSAFAVPLISAV
jgi:hypothetical protein